MKINCGSKAEVTKELFPKRIINGLLLKAFADEEGNTDESDTSNNTEEGTNNEPTVNYEDLISKARQQERNKQYGKIEKLNEANRTLTEQHNNDLLKIAELEKQIEDSNKKLTNMNGDESEAVSTLKKEIEGLKGEKEEISKEFDKYKSENQPLDRESIEKEIREELESEFKVKTYKAEKLAEYKEELFVPELVYGDTIEEIDETLQKALERSEEIAQKFNNAGNNNSTDVKPKSGSPSRISDEDITVETIASLDPSSPEYAEFRKKMGLK